MPPKSYSASQSVIFWLELAEEVCFVFKFINPFFFFHPFFSLQPVVALRKGNVLSYFLPDQQKREVTLSYACLKKMEIKIARVTRCE